MPDIHLWGALRPAAGGARSVAVEASTIAELFERLAERYPGMQPYIDRGIAVSINGEVYRDNHYKALPADVEIYLLPRIAGG